MTAAASTHSTGRYLRQGGAGAAAPDRRAGGRRPPARRGRRGAAGQRGRPPVRVDPGGAGGADRVGERDLPGPAPLPGSARGPRRRPPTGCGRLPDGLPEQVLTALIPKWIDLLAGGGYQLSEAAADTLPVCHSRVATVRPR
jgi:hypothetical protein